MNNVVINTRIDSRTKKDAQKVLSELGLDLSSAIKLFLKKVIISKSVPFEIRTENGFTPAQEKQMIREGKWARKYGKKYSSAEELIKALRKI